MPNILLVGKPGSGKGTVSEFLIQRGFCSLSTGDLLRKEARKETQRGREIAQLLTTGKFASNELIFELVFDFLKENIGKNILFDGFPRNVAQAQECLNKGICFEQVIELDASDDLVRQRILGRRVHVPSGRVYNIYSKPPKVEGLDDETQEPLEQRGDDHPEVLQARLELYWAQTYPVKEFLETKGIPVATVNAQLPLQEQIALISNLLEKQS